MAHPAQFPDLLGDFVVDEVLGEGGSSVVYAARRDGQDIALKVLRDDIVLTDGECRRFLAEADRLGRLSHPGVIRVLDAGLLPDGRPYLALPRLRGETLASRLARGPLPMATALGYFYCAADAVSALHEAGLLHRDLKPENFFVDGDGDRLVLLDFGIAREPDSSPSTTTQQGQIRGTPAYMAPERFFGVAASASSEVYELAATFYVMLTGTLPWAAGTDLDARLNPSLASTIPGAMASVLRGALAVRVETRPPSVAALAAAVRVSETAAVSSQATMTLPNAAASQAARAAGTGVDEIVRGGPLAKLETQPTEIQTAHNEPTEKRSSSTPRSRRRTVMFVVGGVAIAGALGVVAVIARTPQGALSNTVHLSARQVVIVLGPRNLSPNLDDNWLSTAIAERLRLELEAGRRLQVPTGETLAQLSLDVTSPGGVASGELLRDVRARSSAATVVTSSYLAEPDGTLHLTFLAQNTTTGAVVASATTTGPRDQLSKLVGRTGGELRIALGGGTPVTDAVTTFADALPEGSEASRLYAEGLACLQHSDAVCAKDRLSRAVLLAPQSAIVHDALAQAWHELGADAGAKTESLQAVTLGTKLPEEQRLMIQAHAAAYAFDWPRAADAYAVLWQKWPDDVRYGLGLVDAQSRTSKPSDAFATLERVRHSPAATMTDGRFDLAEAHVADRANDFAHEARASERAAAAADALGEVNLGARARLSQGWALETLGQLDQSSKLLEQALRMFGETGDRIGTARALLDLGTLMEAKADLPEARRLYEQSLKLAREIGNQQIAATVLLDLGQVLAESGDPTGARARYEEALGIAKQLADVNVIEDALVDLGSLASRAGNYPAAEASFDEALALGRKHEHHDVVAAVLIDMSNVENGRGDEHKALVLARQGVQEARKTNQPVLLTTALVALAGQESQVGTFEAAERAFDEIERLQEKAHNRAGLASTRTTRVGVLYGAGKLAQSEQLAISTLAGLDAKTDPDDVGWLKVHLGRIHVQRNELAQAAQLFDEASAVLATAEDLRLSVEVKLNAARVLAARGHIPQARAEVAKVRAEGVAMNIDETVRYAEIVSAEISWKYDHDPAARQRLRELARTLRASGSANLALEAEFAAK